jgi:deoxyribonuclease-4
VIDAVGDLDIPEGVTLLFENTAGKGTTVGKEFSALSRMVEETETNRVGVCLDKCHMYAAGYDIAEEFDTVMSEVETELGTGNIQLLHLNDSKHPLGSEKDEHQHIGEGEIKEQGFRNLLDSELGKTPKVLETPTNGKGYADNIERVRDLASQ